MARTEKVWPIWITAALALFLSLAVLCSPAVAERRVALVVANANYAKAPLGNPAVDIRLVVPALQNLGFEVTAVKDADLGTFDQALGAFADQAKGADVALFYFAGHGFAVNDGVEVRNYLMSTSADVSSNSDRVIRAGGIALDEIIAQLGVAKTTLIFVDACRNDPRVTRGTSSRGLAAIPRSTGGSVFVGLSTRVGSTAADGTPGQGSPFARAFVAHIGEANVRVDDAFTKVRIDVERETDSRQRPDVGLYELDHPVVLRPLEMTPTTTVPAADPALGAWNSVKDSSSAAVLKAFADSFPDSVYAKLALARIDEINAALVKPVAPNQPTGGVDGRTAGNPDVVASLPAGVKEVPDCANSSASGQAGSAGGCQYANQASEPVPVQLCDKLASTEQDIYVDFEAIDAQRAVPACQAAIKQYPNEPRFSFELGRAYHSSNEYRKALAAYRQAAEGGFPLAMTMVGQFYAEGTVETQNCVTAEHWLVKAVRAGDALNGLPELSKLYGNCPEVADSGRSTQLLFMSLTYGNDESMNDILNGDAFKDRAMITRLQNFLKDHGYYTGQVDGRLSKATQVAVQRAHEAKWDRTTLDDEDRQAFEAIVAGR